MEKLDTHSCVRELMRARVCEALAGLTYTDITRDLIVSGAIQPGLEPVLIAATWQSGI